MNLNDHDPRLQELEAQLERLLARQRRLGFLFGFLFLAACLTLRMLFKQ